MRTITTWTDEVPDHEGKKQVVWDVAFKPAHRGDIFTLSCSRDGLYIASGGADKAVSVWTWDLVQKFTYNHAGSVQTLSFNPVVHNMLASASEVDFAVWSMTSPSLRKLRMPSKVLSTSWTADGQFLALGMLSGTISIRDATGQERLKLERGAPVWDLAWGPAKVQQAAPPPPPQEAPAPAPAAMVDVLTVACWDSTVSFYQLSADGGALTQIGKDRALGEGMLPCSVRHFGGSGEYLLVAGSDRKASLLTRDGVRLAAVTEGGDWVWRAVQRPRSNQVAVAGNGGTLSMHNIVFSTVHGLFGDRYAFREAMTDVVVQHLVSEERVRIKCRDYVKKVAVYRDRLAVQLSDRIIIYELSPSSSQGAVTQRGGEAGGGGEQAPPAAAAAASFSASTDTDQDMHYRVRDRIQAALECNLLVVTSVHVVLCLERKLQLYDFGGAKVREWVLDAVIRYIKVAGGPRGREALLVGLKSGAVLRIFVDNPFPEELVQHGSSVRCLDLSMSRGKLAVVDENAAVTAYDVATREVLFTEAGANSVSWNSEAEDMLCYSGNGQLAIKTGNFPLFTQKLPGFVVGFTGSKVFCLHAVAMQTVDVPQSASLARYIEVGAWDAAYRTACLGVTDADWKGLGDAALHAIQLPVARAAFTRASHMRSLELLNAVEGHRRAAAAAAARGAGPPLDAPAAAAALWAEAAAYAGRFAEAGRLFVAAGLPERAIAMFSDLRLWGEARSLAAESGGGNVAALMRRQAQWCEQSGDIPAAAEIYCAVGMPSRAVALLGEAGMLLPQLLELTRSLIRGPQAPSQQQAGLAGERRLAVAAAAELFRKGGHTEAAREALLALGDKRGLLHLLLDGKRWAEALALAAASEAGGGGGGSLLSLVHLAHADELAAAERYEEAHAEYEAGGAPERAAALLEGLLASALHCEQFSAASWCAVRLARESALAARRLVEGEGTLTSGGKWLAELAARHQRYRAAAQVFAAYAVVRQLVTLPSCTATTDAVFHAARFCVSALATLAASGEEAQAAGPQQPPPSPTLIAANGELAALLRPVSSFTALFALSLTATLLQCYQVARAAIEPLSSVAVLPAPHQETVDRLALRLQCTPNSDREEFAHVCYRCGLSQPPLSTVTATIARHGARSTGPAELAPASRQAAALLPPTEACPLCAAAVVRSAVSFEPLPLVEFVPGAGISLMEALQLLQEEPPDQAAVAGVIGDWAPTTNTAGAQRLSFQGFDPAAAERGSSQVGRGSGEELFLACCQESARAEPSSLESSGSRRAPPSALQPHRGAPAASAGKATGSGCVVLPRNVLRALNPATVFVVRAIAAPARTKDVGSGADDSDPAAGEACMQGRAAALQAPALALEDTPGFSPRFFKNVIPDVGISMCTFCSQLMQLDEFELELCTRGCSPCCNARV